MPPKDCVEKGCDSRMSKLEDDMNDLINPESGVVGKLYSALNTKVTSKYLIIVLTVFMSIIGAAFTYTTLSASSLGEEIKTTNDHTANVVLIEMRATNKAQDDQILALKEELKSIRNDMKDIS